MRRNGEIHAALRWRAVIQPEAGCPGPDVLKVPNLMRKTNYHQLATYVAADRIAPEIAEKLDLLHSVSQLAKPR